MRVIMGIDQARNDQLARSIHHFVTCALSLLADRNNSAILNDNIANRRLVNVAAMVIDLPTADQNSF